MKYDWTKTAWKALRSALLGGALVGGLAAVNSLEASDWVRTLSPFVLPIVAGLLTAARNYLKNSGGSL
jgi:hypothetical protein